MTKFEGQGGLAYPYFLAKKIIYIIIKQREKKKMALTYDKYTYQTKNATRRRWRVAGLFDAFLLSQLKINVSPSNIMSNDATSHRRGSTIVNPAERMLFKL